MSPGRAAVPVVLLLLSFAAATAASAQAPPQRPARPAEQYGRPIHVADAPPGASSCSGCHPVSRTVETAAGRLNGRNPAEIVAAVQAFRAGQRPSTVMDRISKGFTDDEVKAIADWYGAQKD